MSCDDQSGMREVWDQIDQRLPRRERDKILGKGIVRRSGVGQVPEELCNLKELVPERLSGEPA